MASDTPTADSVEPLPRHIAIVMDGNGRWAQQRGLARIEGHHEGRKATRRIVEECVGWGIDVLSIYAFSTENWRRSPAEVQGLFSLIEAALRYEIDDLHGSHVRLMASGRVSELPPSLQQALADAEAHTAANTGLILNLAVNYSGRAELVDVCRRVAEEAAAGRLSPDAVTEETLQGFLYRPELPDVDLFIRPGGEMRISNFLLWQIAYAEIVVCPVLWPDFAPEHLYEALIEFSRRQRRFGAVPDAEML